MINSKQQFVLGAAVAVPVAAAIVGLPGCELSAFLVPEALYERSIQATQQALAGGFETGGCHYVS